MKISYLSRVEKDLRKISKLGQIAIANKLRNLESEDVLIEEIKLKGFKNMFRVRVGDYRAVYEKSKKEITVITVGHRKDVYKIMSYL